MSWYDLPQELLDALTSPAHASVPPVDATTAASKKKKPVSWDQARDQAAQIFGGWKPTTSLPHASDPIWDDPMFNPGGRFGR